MPTLKSVDNWEFLDWLPKSILGLSTCKKKKKKNAVQVSAVQIEKQMIKVRG